MDVFKIQFILPHTMDIIFNKQSKWLTFLSLDLYKALNMLPLNKKSKLDFRNLLYCFYKQLPITLSSDFYQIIDTDCRI